MLRDFFYKTDSLIPIVNQFKGVELTDDTYITITMARRLSPDSFVWRLEINNERYYMYAEDYVQILTHVTDEIERVAGAKSGELLPVKEPSSGDESGIGTHSTASGYDHVFLYKIKAPPMRAVKGNVNG